MQEAKFRLKAIELWAEFTNRPVDEDLIEHFNPYSTTEIIKPFIPKLKERFSFGEISIRYGMRESTVKSIYYRLNQRASFS